MTQGRYQTRWEITPVAMEVIRRLGEERAERNRWLRDSQVDRSRTNTEIHIEGVAAEMGCRELLPGSDIRLEIERPDDGIDGWWRGESLSVKGSHRGPTPALLYGPDQDMKADLALVCWVNLPEWFVDFTGWTDLATWRRLRGPKDGYVGKWLEACHLWDPQVLFENPPPGTLPR